MFYWRLGEKVRFKRDMQGVDDPVAELARETNQSGRTLRDCARVRRAFGCARLRKLVAMGLCWSSIRGLASEALAKRDRNKLIRLFEVGKLTNLELREKALDLASAAQRARPGDGPAVQFTRDMAGLRRLATETQGAMAEVARRIAPDGDLAGALTEPESRQKLLDTLIALVQLGDAAISLAHQGAVTAALAGHPFAELDGMLGEFREHCAAVSGDRRRPADGGVQGCR
jgi:hypothetical protein